MSSRPPSRRHHPPGFGPSSGPRPHPRVKVILHRNTDVSLMAVVRTVMELTHFGEAEATYRMWDAHYNGQTLVLLTHLERAELYVEQFGERGLAASIEPE
jgi:ATP-dependent Clp protease adaptor protein ClpS